MAQKPARKTTGTTIISKATGLEVDRKRSLAARKAAATRKANQTAEQARTAERRSLRLHHKIIAAGGIFAVLFVTGLAIHHELSAFAAAAKKPTTSKTPAPTVKSSQTYQAPGGYCLDNAGGNKKNGNKVQLYTCNGTKAQTWTMTSSGNVKNANGYCLDTLGTNPKAGDKARLNQCAKGTEQQWTNNNGTLVNKKSGLCLEGAGNKNALVLKKCAAASKSSQKLAYNYVQVTTNGKKVTIRGATSQTELNLDHATTTTVDLSKRNGTGSKNSGTSAGGSIGTAKTNKQALAKRIMDSGKLRFLDGSNSSAAQRRADIADVASGRKSGNTGPCGMNINVLRVIAKLTENHSNIVIGDTNSLCDGNNSRNNLGSRHYGGNGSALDISGIDGMYFSCVTGSDCRHHPYTAASAAKAREVLNEISPLLLKAGQLHNASQVGQTNCYNHPNIGSVQWIPDYCNHIHVDFPPWSDPGIAKAGQGNSLSNMQGWVRGAY